MGQKIHPLGLRVGVSQQHRSKWCVKPRYYYKYILEDRLLRESIYQYLEERPAIERRRTQQEEEAKTKQKEEPKKSFETKDVETSTVLTSSVQTVPSKTNQKGDAKSDLQIKTKDEETSSASRFNNAGVNKKGRRSIEIGNIFVHRLRTMYHYKTKEPLDVVEVTIETPRTSSILYGKGKYGLRLCAVRFQNALEKMNQKKRAPDAPPLRILLSVIRIRKPAWEASLIAQNLVDRLETRASFRRLLKDTLLAAKKSNIPGIKIQISGRLNGAEIARTEWVRHGRVPLQTLRADLDYSYKTAKTMYGILGIKVWTLRKK